MLSILRSLSGLPGRFAWSYLVHARQPLKLHPQRFSEEALVCGRLSHRNIVSFIGTYSTTKHPFSLVFDFAGHLDLRQYLGTHPMARRLELVRFHSSEIPQIFQ